MCIKRIETKLARIIHDYHEYVVFVAGQRNCQYIREKLLCAKWNK